MVIFIHFEQLKALHLIDTFWVLMYLHSPFIRTELFILTFSLAPFAMKQSMSAINPKTKFFESLSRITSAATRLKGGTQIFPNTWGVALCACLILIAEAGNFKLGLFYRAHWGRKSNSSWKKQWFYSLKVMNLSRARSHNFIFFSLGK